MSLQAQWVKEECPVTHNLNAIHFIDDTTGWVVGDKGTILYRDANVWIQYRNITVENLNSVVFTDRQNGWAVGAKGTILRYYNGIWEAFTSPTTETLYSISFIDANHGIAVGESGTMIRFESGTWKKTERLSKGSLYSVAARNGLVLIGGGRENISIPLLKSTVFESNGFTNFYDPNYTMIRSITIENSDNIWAVGIPGTIFHYNGLVWKKIEMNEKLPSLNSITFLSADHGIAAGYSGTILRYTENEWISEDSPVDIKLNAVAIAGNTHYVIGNGGTILTNKRESGVTTNLENALYSAIRVETYPNPCDAILNIAIPENEMHSTGILTVSSAVGKIVLSRKLASTSDKRVEQIDTSQFGSGLYIVTIRYSEGRLATGKFIVKH
jgi:photosystem II stability/assembly factor-like uncharacterized protein